MKTQVSIPIDTELFLDLADFLKENGDPRDPVDMVSVAVEYWLQNADMKKGDLLQQPKASSRGFIWKELFLPQGTEIRMTYKGTIYRANVVGDDFVYDGKPTSPGAMVNTVSGTSRNAWRDLWIKRPNDREWISAESLRSTEKLFDDLLPTAGL
jgi:hypothetical protein